MSYLARIAPWLVPAALWLWLCWHLHYEWSLNAQYNYGWTVPFLAAFIFYLRWETRPPARATDSSRNGALLASAALLFLFLPIRLVEEANPDWRLLSWAFALLVVAFSLLALARAGGSGWVRHFAFAVCFPLVAVPWLVQVENTIVQGMTGAVAYVAVEIAGWLGVGAFQLGNVIELHNGFVGVNEACSGVKTLQAAIMVALALGELFQLTVLRRIALLAGGCAWVFACNVMRASVLVLIAARQGPAALDRWHDLIGTAVLIVGMSGLLGLAWILKPNAEHRTSNAERRMERERATRFPIRRSAFDVRRSAFACSAGLAWLAFIFAVTALWYRSHERRLVELPAWNVVLPDQSRNLSIPEETRAILRYNHAQSAAWENPRAIHWWAFFARWEPQRAALQLVRSHSPEICLPAVGRTFVRERPPLTVETDALPLRFRVYEFTQNERPLFVFVCIQEDKISEAFAPSPSAEWSARGRLLAVWHGQRNLGQRLLEIAVIGFDDFLRAREAAATNIREMVLRPGA